MSAALPAKAFPAAQIKHRFLAVDNGSNRLLLVDQIEGKGWTVPVPAGSRDLRLLSGGRVLVSHGNGAGEFDLATGAKGWSVEGFANVTSAQRLTNGNTLLGLTDSKGVNLVEVGPDTREKARLIVPGLADLRLMDRLPNGNTLLSLATAHKVVEVDAVGSIVWNGALTDKGYQARRLANGHTVATSGEDCRIYDFPPKGDPVLVGGSLEKFTNAHLLWFSGFEILANGDFFVANWNGHGHEGQGPHAVEFDAANNLVWSWEDHVAATTVTNVLTWETPATTIIRIRPDRKRSLENPHRTPQRDRYRTDGKRATLTMYPAKYPGNDNPTLFLRKFKGEP